MSPSEPTLKYTVNDDEPLSSAIITAISNAKDRDITEEECVLYNTIDSDALDGMFREESKGDTIKVEFTTHDAIVIIWGNGRITIEVQDLEANPTYG